MPLKKYDILLVHDWIKPLKELEIIESEGIPRNLIAERKVSPTYWLIKNKQPDFVFMGHMHGPRIKAKLGKSIITGLRKFDDRHSPHSVEILEIPSK